MSTRNERAGRVVAAAGADGEVGDRADARQRFAAEPEGGQVSRSSNEVSFEVACRWTASGRSSAAMPQPSSTTSISSMPPPCDRDPDPGGAGVDRVFDQLLDDRDRALDDLSGGDLADRFVRRAGEGSWRLVTHAAIRRCHG